MPRFSRPVRSSSRDAYWPATPMRLRASAGWRRTSMPATVAEPGVGARERGEDADGRRLAGAVRAEDQRIVPSATLRSRPRRACVSPKHLWRPTASIMARDMLGPMRITSVGRPGARILIGRPGSGLPGARIDGMPRIAVIFTGGTIAMRQRRRCGRATCRRCAAEELLATVPGLDEVAEVEPIDWGLVPASHLSFDQVLDIGRQPGCGARPAGDRRRRRRAGHRRHRGDRVRLGPAAAAGQAGRRGRRHAIGVAGGLRRAGEPAQCGRRGGRSARSPTRAWSWPWPARFTVLTTCARPTRTPTRRSRARTPGGSAPSCGGRVTLQRRRAARAAADDPGACRAAGPARHGGPRRRRASSRRRLPGAPRASWSRPPAAATRRPRCWRRRAG